MELGHEFLCNRYRISTWCLSGHLFQFFIHIYVSGTDLSHWQHKLILFTQKSELMFMKKVYYFSLCIILITLYWISSNMIFLTKDSKAFIFKELEKKSQIPFTLSMDLKTITSDKSYKIIGGGKISTPSDFKSSENPDIFILHGTDNQSIRTFIQSDSFQKPSNHVIIMTTFCLLSILNDNQNLFDSFMDNFKKSGDILKSDGEIFYYLDELSFDIPENLSGIILSFPVDRYFSNVKNYGLAHLLQNDFSITGLENPFRFLELIHFPKPQGFEGTFKELLNGARNDYNQKFKNNILHLDTKRGMVVSKKLFPGMKPKKSNKALPLFTTIRLSSHIYLTGLIRD